MRLPDRVHILGGTGALRCQYPCTCWIMPDLFPWPDSVFESFSGLDHHRCDCCINRSGYAYPAPCFTTPANSVAWRALGIIVLAGSIPADCSGRPHGSCTARNARPLEGNKLTRALRNAQGCSGISMAGLTLACALGLLGGRNDPVSTPLGTGLLDRGIGRLFHHDASIGYLQTAPIEADLHPCFMLISGINFALHFLAWRFRS